MSTLPNLVGFSDIDVEPAAHFYIIRAHRYARLCRAALDLVVLSPGFLKGTTKSLAIKTKPLRGGYASPDSKTLGGIPFEAGEGAGHKRVYAMTKVLKFYRLQLVSSIKAPAVQAAAVIDYDAIEREVQEVYREIFAMDTIEKQNRALNSWYSYLKATCTEDNLCIECLRERRP